MIAVDTSALIAIVLDEPDAEACIAALEAEDDILISAGTVAEALIVSACGVRPSRPPMSRRSKRVTAASAIS